MGSLTPVISGKLVALDSAPLIYYLEENPIYLPVCDELFTALNEGRARGVSSVLTLTEVLVKPLRDGRTDLVNAYRELLTNTNGITLRPIDAIIGERTARLRASMNGFECRMPFSWRRPLSGELI